MCVGGIESHDIPFVAAAASHDDVFARITLDFIELIYAYISPEPICIAYYGFRIIAADARHSFELRGVGSV